MTDSIASDRSRRRTTGSTAVECPYCGRRFAGEAVLALHEGRRHEGRLTQAERAAYAAARERESEILRRYKIKALAALVVLYFGLLFAFALFG